MKLYAIGDIHGCYDQLVELVKKIDEHANGVPYKLVFIGDYVDRGPKSFEVVEYLNDLRVSGNSNEYVFLKGNHEDMMLDLKQWRLWQLNGGATTETSYMRNNSTIEDHKDFYDNLEVYHRHGEFVFVHAGIRPDKTLEEMSALGDEVFIWDRTNNYYDGEFTDNVFVVHGHTPVKEVSRPKNQINIDTGAVFGVIDEANKAAGYNKLTAICINSRDKIEIIQVMV